MFFMSNTLLGLISSHPATTSIADFASRIGVSRAAVYRWDSAMPTPEVLRRIADALSEPYSTVLTAALTSSGYIHDIDDILVGQQIYVVNSDGGSGAYLIDPWPVPIAAYTTATTAERFVDNAESSPIGTCEYAPVTISSTRPAHAVRYYAALTRGPGDRYIVSTHSSSESARPLPALSDEELAATGGVSEPLIAVANGYLMRAEANSFTEMSARKVVDGILQLLSDRIPPLGTTFSNVDALTPITDPLPEKIRPTGVARPHSDLFTIDVADLLSETERADAAAAYRQAAEVTATAADQYAAYDRIVTERRHIIDGRG